MITNQVCAGFSSYEAFIAYHRQRTITGDEESKLVVNTANCLHQATLRRRTLERQEAGRTGQVD